MTPILICLFDCVITTRLHPFYVNSSLKVIAFSVQRSTDRNSGISHLLTSEANVSRVHPVLSHQPQFRLLPLFLVVFAIIGGWSVEQCFSLGRDCRVLVMGGFAWSDPLHLFISAARFFSALCQVMRRCVCSSSSAAAQAWVQYPFK